MLGPLTANPETIVRGQDSSLSVDITGGVPPYFLASSAEKLSVGKIPGNSLVAVVAPEQSQEYAVEVTDERGTKHIATTTVQVRTGEGSAASRTDSDDGTDPTANQRPRPAGPIFSPPPPPPAPKELSAQGPLAQALAELFEKARKSKIAKIGKLILRFPDSTSAFKVQQAIAGLKDVEVVCEYDVVIEAEGIEKMHVEFKGRPDKAQGVKAFLDAQIRAASDSDFEATYTVRFTAGYPTYPNAGEKIGKDLTRYGAGEAYVEAHADATASASSSGTGGNS